MKQKTTREDKTKEKDKTRHNKTREEERGRGKAIKYSKIQQKQDISRR